MPAYLSHFFSGEVDPAWPHAVLLSISVLASFAVGGGIIFESHKYSARIQRIAMFSVIVGVVVEAACTITLFVFDEGISNAQQEKIIGLETRLAARSISDEQLERIVSQLVWFGPQSYQIIPYWKNRESLAFANRISAGLVKAGWKLENPDRYTTLVGVLTGVVINIDKAASERTKQAGAALLKALKEANVDAETDETSDNPPSQRINMQVGIKP